MTTRRTEEVDANGRRRVASENAQAIAEQEDIEAVDEERVVRPGPWDVAGGLIQMTGLLVLAGLAAVETMLGFRLGFLAAAANPGNSFVDFIYDSTDWLIEPFGGTVSNEAVEGGGTLESATLVAMIVYAAAVFLFLLAFWVIAALPSPSGTRSSLRRASRREHSVHEH